MMPPSDSHWDPLSYAGTESLDLRLQQQKCILHGSRSQRVQDQGAPCLVSGDSLLPDGHFLAVCSYEEWGAQTVTVFIRVVDLTHPVTEFQSCDMVTPEASPPYSVALGI